MFNFVFEKIKVMAYEDPKLQWPFAMYCTGPSQCGKTVFTTKLCRYIDEMSTVAPKEIIWYFGEYQPAYRELVAIPKLRLVQGLPDLVELKGNTEPKIIILDDLMNEVKDSQLTQLFTRSVHHWNLSCVFLVQNLFFGGRTARVNAHYLVLFKNPSDRLQVATLARQLYPKKSKHFLEAYEEATSQPYTYLFVDCHQTCNDQIRLRSNIFPGEITFVYTP